MGVPAMRVFQNILVTLMIFALASCGSGGGGGSRGGSSSANTYMSAVTISDTVMLDQPFDRDVSNYSGTVANDVTSFSLTPSLEDPNSVVTINGMAVEAGRPSPAVPLNVGENVITMVVTAPDGSTQRTYTFLVKRAAGLNANLAGLSLSSGTLDQTFSTAVFDYSATVGNNVSSLSITPTTESSAASVLVNTIPVNSGQASAAIPLMIGSNSIIIVVTAEDQTTQKNYRVVVTRADSSGSSGNGVVLSNNAALSALSSSTASLSPAFAAGTTSYSATVANNISSFALTATLADSKASLSLNGAVAVSGQSNNIPLNVGSNNVIVHVWAQDGVAQRTYTVNVTRQPLTNASLSNLVLSSGSLNPVFASGTLSYSVSVANAVASLNLTPVVADSSASIKINNVSAASGNAHPLALSVGSNLVAVVVTAQDGVTSKTYSVTITRASASATTGSVDLSNLTVSAGALDQAFNAGTTSYSKTVTNAVSSVTVTPTLVDATSVVKVNNVTVASGAASGAISLAVGSNTLTVLVTSQDGLANKTYTIGVTRQPANNANLSGLSVSTGAFNETFAAATLAYSQTVANGVSSLTVTPVVEIATSTVKVNNVTVASGAASGAVALAVGVNTINVVVTAENGTTTKTYALSVTRQGAGNANLSSLVLSTGPMDQGFVATTTGYSQTVANTVTSLTITPTLADTNASVKVNNVAVPSGNASGSIALTVGSNPISVLVTAQDGVTQKNYLVTVTRQANTDATLSGLSLSSGTLSPTFASGTLSYTASVTNTTSQISLTATANNANYQSITVNNNSVTSGLSSGWVSLAVGSNTIDVVVTAQDGQTVKTYSVVVTRVANTNANLSALSLSTGTLSPAFASATTAYTVTVANAISSMQFVATAADSSYSSLKVNNVAATSGLASAAVSLAVGNNAIPVQVIAQDGTTTKTYTVTVTRLAGVGSNADLTGLVPSADALDQIFQSSSTAYTMTVNYLVAGIRLTPTMSDSAATMKVNGQTVANATASQVIALAEGQTVINVVVTAQDLVTTKTYTITVTRQTATAFAERAYIKASSSGAGDEFGNAVAISGNTMVVGAPFEDSAATGIDGNSVDDCATTALNCASNSGAAYVFERDGAGVWSFSTYIKAPDTNVDDNFGYSVDIDGDTIVVGAPEEDSNSTGVTNAAAFPANWSNSLAGASGAAYVYKRSGSSWVQEAFVKATNTGNGDRFGISVAISGDHLAVGAYFESSNSQLNPTNNTAVQSGAAYTYRRSGVTWSNGEYLKASNISNSDKFGFELALNGNILAVGSPLEDGSQAGINPTVDDAKGQAGAVYVFQYNGSTWGTPDYIKASDPAASDQFGHAIDIKGDVMVVGAPHEASTLADQTKEWFYGAGTVYVFNRNPSTGVWSQTQRIRASTPTQVEKDDYFGRSIALGDGVMVITAPGEDSNATTINGSQADNTSAASGAAYVMTWNGTSWVHSKFVKVSNASAGDELGGTVATSYPTVGVDVSGDTIVIGSRLEDGSGTGVDPVSNDAAASAGAAYIFQ